MTDRNNERGNDKKKPEQVKDGKSANEQPAPDPKPAGNATNQTGDKPDTGAVKGDEPVTTGEPEPGAEGPETKNAATGKTPTADDVKREPDKQSSAPEAKQPASGETASTKSDDTTSQDKAGSAEASASRPAEAAPAQTKREQLEAEIRERLKKELSERHGSDVAVLADKADKAATPGSGASSPPAVKSKKAKGSRKPVIRERTAEEKQAARIREGKAQIEGRLRKISFLAYILVSLICIGGFIVYLKMKKDKPPTRVRPPEAYQAQPEAPSPERRTAPAQSNGPSKQFERLMRTVEIKIGAKNYMGAIEDLEGHAERFPRDADHAAEEVARIKRDYPKATGQGRHWDFAEDNIMVLAESENRADLEKALEMLVDFKQRHPDEALIATWHMEKIKAKYFRLFNDFAPVQDPTEMRKRKKAEEKLEEDYGDWGGDNWDGGDWAN